jgi:hypothetical protein
MSTEAAITELLRSRGAEDLAHPGGTLGSHLQRVQQRLARLGAPEPVQLAGRAHAVYGTDGFPLALLTVDERPLLAEIIGQQAEQLVYRYGACDRERTWDALAVTRQVRDRFTDAYEDLDDSELRAFADLSIVNELDVAEHSQEFLDRHGDYFRRLTTAWAPLLSPAVLSDARHVFRQKEDPSR